MYVLDVKFVYAYSFVQHLPDHYTLVWAWFASKSLPSCPVSLNYCLGQSQFLNRRKWPLARSASGQRTSPVCSSFRPRGADWWTSQRQAKETATWSTPLCPEQTLDVQLATHPSSSTAYLLFYQRDKTAKGLQSPGAWKRLVNFFLRPNRESLLSCLHYGPSVSNPNKIKLPSCYSKGFHLYRNPLVT